MSRYTGNCPHCGATLGPKNIPVGRAYSFYCPACNSHLRLAAPHGRLIFVVSLILSAALGFHFGLRGIVFAVGTIVGSAAFYVGGQFLVGLVEPPRFELR
jgi:hypothetical protein